MTGVVKVTNNAFGTLASSISSSATTIALDSGQGARFPTLSSPDYFYGTLIDTSNNLEIVKVTARSTDSLTVTRAQDNTSARAFSTGDRFELRPTAKLFEDIQTNARDLNGQELILDADGDTSITADTDDQIDIKIAGSDKITLTATGITINTASAGIPAINLNHSNANADNFTIQSGIPGVANSGFSIVDADASANRLVIDSSGNIGVAMTPDTAVKLSVSGSIGPTNGSAASPTYTFYGDPDTGIYRSAANTIGFATNGAAVGSIDSNGNLAIKKDNTAVDTRIHIDNTPDDKWLTLEQAGRKHALGTYFSSGSTLSRLDFFLSNGNTNGGNNVKMKLFSSGNLELPDGNLKLGASGAIEFGHSVTSASGASAASTQLDHYEEGTWTPTWSGLSSASYLTQFGKYTRIGNRVFGVGRVTSNSHSGSGNQVQVNGFPYATANNTVAFHHFNFGHTQGFSYTGFPYAYVVSNATYAQFQVNNNGSLTNLVYPSSTTIDIIFAFMYEAA